MDEYVKYLTKIKRMYNLGYTTVLYRKWVKSVNKLHEPRNAISNDFRYYSALYAEYVGQC